VLKALNVHVVARYSKGQEEQHLVPLHEADGSVGAVVVALPFVNEFRLGVRTTGVDSNSLRETIAEKFRGLYRQLCDKSVEIYGELPMIGMGHLTVGGDVKSDDSPLQVHMVGTIGGLPVSVFDERLRYVALGHIHRMLPVQTGDTREVWYSGTPIPVRFSEAKTDRKALVVTVDDRKTYHPETLTIPVSRELLEISGDFDSVNASVSTLTNSAPLPTLLKVTLEVDQFQATLASQLNDTLDRRFEG
jgi:exonuclease SbcD